MDDRRLDEILRAQLSRTLDRTDLDWLAGDGGDGKYEGKVRDNYTDRARGERVIVVTDRLSAFDRVLTTIPFKGQVLNQIAQYWFEETRHIAPNHMLAVPDPNVMIVRECTPLRGEFVMRAYLTGVTDTSIWRAYSKGDRTYCGHKLPDGMKKNERLPDPILTPTTKAEHGAHDEVASAAELVSRGLVSEEHMQRASAIAAALFDFGVRRAAERGLILVDTKYEMGVTPDGEVIVIDEIHTPDSSRYWYADDYHQRLARGEEPRSLDKEFVRRWYVETAGYKGDGPIPALPDDIRVEAAKRYIKSYEIVTGRPFVPDTAAPEARIAATLSSRRKGQG